MKLRKGEKAVVTVNKKKESPEIRRGMIPGVSVPDYLKRRVRSGIRFFDCGYKWNGSAFETIDWLDPLASTPITVNLSTGALQNVLSTTPLSYTTSRDDLIFETDLADFPTTFKLVDNDYLTTLELNFTINEKFYLVTAGTAESLAYWDNGIFRPDGTGASNPNQHLIVTVTRFSEPVQWSTTTAKITATRDYAADAVSLTLGNSFDVYLMPALGFMQGGTGYTVPATSTQSRHLNHLYLPITRETLLDDTHPDHLIAKDLFTTTNSYSSSGGTLGQYTEAYNALVYMLDNYAYRNVQRDFTVAGSVWAYSYPGFASFIDGSIFLPPPDLPVGFSSMSVSTEVAYRPSPIGTLQAVIKQGGQYYYVWKTTFP